MSTIDTGTKIMGDDDNGHMNITRNEFNALRDMVKDIHQRILGTRDTPGMVVRMDRIETWMSSRQWLERTIIGSVVTLGVGFLGIMAALVAIIIRMS
jgi:hypothetical protein